MQLAHDERYNLIIWYARLLFTNHIIAPVG